PADYTPRQGQPRQTWSTARRDEIGVDGHPLGRLPGSVWKIPTAPLVAPKCRLVLDGRTVQWVMSWEDGWERMRHFARHGWNAARRPSLRPEIDHFAAFPATLARQVILGWSPAGICVECGAGRRPVADVATIEDRRGRKQRIVDFSLDAAHGPDGRGG